MTRFIRMEKGEKSKCENFIQTTQQTTYQHESQRVIHTHTDWIRLSQAALWSHRAYLCCSQVRTSLPDTSCFHCSRMCNARRSRPVACKTCCSRSHSSARRSWPGSGTQTGPQGRCESASASAGWGWSCRNERLSLSVFHLLLKQQFWHHQCRLPESWKIL